MDSQFLKISQKIKRCKKCSLWRTRTQAVPGDGNWRAKILVIGEAPGREEDKQGRPFCGRAGKFLDELLNSAGLSRQKVFITNVVKCRPPKNRTPKKEEVAACHFWLEEQIKIFLASPDLPKGEKPKLIITLGNSALNWFFPNLRISQVHGRIRYPASSIKYQIFPVYHPAAAFRRGNLRKVLKKDFRKLNLIYKKLR